MKYLLLTGFAALLVLGLSNLPAPADPSGELIVFADLLTPSAKTNFAIVATCPQETPDLVHGELPHRLKFPRPLKQKKRIGMDAPFVTWCGHNYCGPDRSLSYSCCSDRALMALPFTDNWSMPLAAF